MTVEMQVIRVMRCDYPGCSEKVECGINISASGWTKRGERISETRYDGSTRKFVFNFSTWHYCPKHASEAGVFR